MNCTICGMDTSHGALLCRPCKAALKRARQLTIQEIPRHGVRAAAHRGHRGLPVQSSSHTDERGRSAKINQVARMLLGAAAFAALAGAVYIVERELTGRSAIAQSTPAVVARAPDPAPAAAAVANDAAIEATPSRAAAPEPTAHRERVRVATPPRTASAVPTTAARGSLGDTRESRRQDKSLAPPPTYPDLDSFGPLAEAPRAPPPAPVVAQRAPPPPDRWQIMNEALSRCATEGGWSGFICDQRVRLASCGGYWGRVAQCPYPPENPR